jgi:glycosyltransferase involved in cell wall biosynthesis
MPSPQKNVFIGPVEIAGFCASLASGLEEQGWAAYTFSVEPNRFDYQRRGRRSTFLALAQRSCKFLCRSTQFPGGYKLRIVLQFFWQLGVFLWALIFCRSYIFVYGRSILPGHADMAVFKKLGRPVIQVYLGSDSRAPYLSGRWNIDIGKVPESERAQKTACEVARITRVLHRNHRRASYVVDNPLSGILQPGPYINWFNMGFPTQDAEDIRSTASRDGVPRILHAPSHEGIKGTAYIDGVLDELRAEGVNFEYVLLRRKTNTEVKAELCRASIVIDQMYSDTPLAGLGCEAAASGCAVVVGGYGWTELRSYLDDQCFPPSVCVQREELKDELRRLISDPAACRRIGEALQDFIQSQWSAKEVAGRYVKLLEGNVPDAWNVQPEAPGYLGGMGGVPEDFAPLIRDVYSECGPEGLGLSPDAVLVQRIRDTYIEQGEGDCP